MKRRVFKSPVCVARIAFDSYLVRNCVLASVGATRTAIWLVVISPDNDNAVGPSGIALRSKSLRNPLSNHLIPTAQTQRKFFRLEALRSPFLLLSSLHNVGFPTG
jgi:hypothetical protein